MISNVFIIHDAGKAVTSKNLQIADVIRAMMESEGCLFNNKEENLMTKLNTEDDSHDGMITA